MEIPDIVSENDLPLKCGIADMRDTACGAAKTILVVTLTQPASESVTMRSDLGG